MIHVYLKSQLCGHFRTVQNTSMMLFVCTTCPVLPILQPQLWNKDVHEGDSVAVLEIWPLFNAEQCRRCTWMPFAAHGGSLHTHMVSY